jgi:hypothetical protein
MYFQEVAVDHTQDDSPTLTHRALERALSAFHTKRQLVDELSAEVEIGKVELSQAREKNKKLLLRIAELEAVPSVPPVALDREFELAKLKMWNWDIGSEILPYFDKYSTVFTTNTFNHYQQSPGDVWPRVDAQIYLISPTQIHKVRLNFQDRARMVSRTCDVVYRFDRALTSSEQRWFYQVACGHNFRTVEGVSWSHGGQHLDASITQFENIIKCIPGTWYYPLAGPWRRAEGQDLYINTESMELSSTPVWTREPEHFDCTNCPRTEVRTYL